LINPIASGLLPPDKSNASAANKIDSEYPNILGLFVEPIGGKSGWASNPSLPI
jgi:hypothetical protein